MRLTSKIMTLGILLGLSTAPLHAQPASKPASKPSSQPSKTRESQGSTSMKDARNVIHADPQSIMPLTKGEKLPETPSLKNPANESVNLSDVTAGKTSLIVFYRGGWCPYCNTHLGELASIQPELEKNGIQILGISPDSPSTLTEYQKEKNLPYALLSDNNHQVAKAFGIAFALDTKGQERLKGFGHDILAASGSEDAFLPVPSVFVVSPEGKVTYAHANADYKKRLSVSEILAAVGIDQKD